MRTEWAFSAAIASAGLLVGVALAWVVVLAGGSMDKTWLLAGFLAVGLGMLVVSVIDRAGGGLSSATEAEEDSDEEEAPEAGAYGAADADEPAPGPRLSVLIISSLMQGGSLAFLAAYFSGSTAAGVFIGLLVGTLSLAVSTLLARRLAPAEG